MPRCATPIPAGRLTSPLRPAHGRSSTGTGAPERGAVCFAPAKSRSAVRSGCAGHFRPGTCTNPTSTTRSNNIALTDHDAAMLRRRRLHYPRTTSRPSPTWTRFFTGLITVGSKPGTPHDDRGRCRRPLNLLYCNTSHASLARKCAYAATGSQPRAWCSASSFPCVDGGGIDERFGGRWRVGQGGGVVEGGRQSFGALEAQGELVAEPVGISGAGFGCCVDETG